MVNQHNQHDNEFWYPQLPDGYQGGGGQFYPQPPAQQNPYPMALPSFGGTPAFNPIPGPNPMGFPQASPWQPPNQFPPYQQHWMPSTSFNDSSSLQFNQMNQAPRSAPPDWTPEYPSAQLRSVDPGAIVNCMFRFTYIWTSRNKGFWFFPTFVGPTSVAGFRWNSRRNRWNFTGLDLRQVQTFTCI